MHRRSEWSEQFEREQGARSARVLGATGEWIAGLAPWSYFFTLTHRLPGDPTPSASPYSKRTSFRPLPNLPAYTRVGLRRHRKMVRDFFYDVLRSYDPAARWWSEMELHASGAPHEHGLAAFEREVPVLSMRQAWYEACGYCVVKPIDGSGVTTAAYVAKYTEKGGAVPPLILGFGLNAKPSHSMVLPRRA